MCTPSKISWKTVGKCLRHIHLCEQIVCQTHQKPTPHPQPFSANLLTRRTFIHLQIPSYVFTIGIRAILSEEMYNQADTVTTVRKLQETFQKNSFFLQKKCSLQFFSPRWFQIYPNYVFSKLGGGDCGCRSSWLCAVSCGILSQSPRYCDVLSVNLSEYQHLVSEYRRGACILHFPNWIFTKSGHKARNSCCHEGVMASPLHLKRLFHQSLFILGHY